MSEVTEEMIERAARAMQAEADTFEAPVEFYVAPEAQRRWEADPKNHGSDGYADALCDGPQGMDWDLESWKILARAAIVAALTVKE